MKKFLTTLGAWTAAAIAALAMSAFALPAVFYALESAQNTPLPYEGVVRLSLLFAHALLLLGAAAYLLMRGTRNGWILWCAFLLSTVVLGGIFFGDTTHRLMEEYSWIRYSTSTLLLLAAAGAAYRRCTLFVLIALAFLFGALDEIFEIHEAVGDSLVRITGTTAAVGDWITVIYALVGALLLVILVRSRRAIAALMTDRLFLGLAVAGVSVYALSTFFDTADFALLDVIKNYIARRMSDPSMVVGDAWSLIWAPRNFLNSIEEVLEHTAALLFALAVFMHGRAVSTPLQRPGQIRRIAGWGIALVTVGITVALIIISFPYTFPSNPVIGERQPVRIADHTNGLLHTDDLDFHPAWGVVIANEGRGTVLIWRDGVLNTLHDPTRVLAQTEAVAATENTVYAADGAQGIIAAFTTSTLETVWSRADGLQEPEGVATDNATLYVLDESAQTITRLVHNKPAEIWRPEHPLWQAPEGVIFDRARGALIVTDDVTGAVFEARFRESVTPIARLAKPEDVAIASDGTRYVTDNGWGAVFAIAPDGGGVRRVLRFLRSYRDLQGVAIDEKQHLFIVTSDGYESQSIMPSILWQW